MTDHTATHPNGQVMCSRGTPLIGFDTGTELDMARGRLADCRSSVDDLIAQCLQCTVPHYSRQISSGLTDALAAHAEYLDCVQRLERREYEVAQKVGQ